MVIPRLLFVHAHPDDETLTTGATIAHYASRGADVRVVTCTMGEEGEVIGDRWAQLAVDAADQLGGYRIAELTSALQHLGVSEPHYLGGAGHWRDSGMAGTEARHRQRFADADPDEAVGALAAVIREMRPHVVVTYDPNGGYGHPDHIQAHRITTAAVDAAAIGEGAWDVPKFYWTVTPSNALAEGLRSLAGVDLPPDWILVEPGDLPFGHPDDEVDAIVEAPDSRAAKVAAMRAHATQVTVEPGGRAFALSNDIALPVETSEYYVLVRGVAGQRDARGWETDLLAGVNLG